jgi:Fic family protein
MTVRSTGKVHTYLLPDKVAKAMEELVHDTNESLKMVDTKDANKHPLITATYFHQQFLNVIHPFSDGNGRIGRIFLNLILLKKWISSDFNKGN